MYFFETEHLPYGHSDASCFNLEGKNRAVGDWVKNGV